MVEEEKDFSSGKKPMTSVFSYTATQGGMSVALKQYSGYATLIVNTASRCSFTPMNIELLNSVQQTYGSQKFTVLAFPCSQFAGQELPTNAEIQKWREEMGLLFPVFDKVQVKGGNADPLYRMLQSQLGSIRWNYTKFLCTRNGTPQKKTGPHLFPRSP